MLARTWPDWRQHLVIVQPDTVVRWHRSAWRRYWTWRSRRARRGRPRIAGEVAAAIRQMTTENPRWGHMRVLGELRKIGFHASLQTVRRYRKDVTRDPSSSWRTFLDNHRAEIWASDFFTRRARIRPWSWKSQRRESGRQAITLVRSSAARCSADSPHEYERKAA